MRSQTNFDMALGQDNVNCVTYGGQATFPLCKAINDVVDVKELEITATYEIPFIRIDNAEERGEKRKKYSKQKDWLYAKS